MVLDRALRARRARLRSTRWSDRGPSDAAPRARARSALGERRQSSRVSAEARSRRLRRPAVRGARSSTGPRTAARGGVGCSVSRRTARSNTPARPSLNRASDFGIERIERATAGAGVGVQQSHGLTVDGRAVRRRSRSSRALRRSRARRARASAPRRRSPRAGARRPRPRSAGTRAPAAGGAKLPERSRSAAWSSRDQIARGSQDAIDDLADQYAVKLRGSRRAPRARGSRMPCGEPISASRAHGFAHALQRSRSGARSASSIDLALEREQLDEDPLELLGIRLLIAGGIGQRHQKAKYRRGSARRLGPGPRKRPGR